MCLKNALHTYLHTAMGAFSAIDNSLRSLSVFIDLRVGKYTYGNDHFHLIIICEVTLPKGIARAKF